jgi:calcineurin-like phosphoesterase family protein
MHTYIIADTHLNHGNIATYCQRPANFTELIRRNWNNTVRDEDIIIHLGDVGIGDWKLFDIENLKGRKILIRGNHDRQHSCQWWMNHGFQTAVDALLYRGCWMTHEPADRLPEHAHLNIHGHLHNIFHGFQAPGALSRDRFALRYPWQRLFAVEYTKYAPVNLEKFLSHPDRYLARGPLADTNEASHGRF